MGQTFPSGSKSPVIPAERFECLTQQFFEFGKPRMTVGREESVEFRADGRLAIKWRVVRSVGATCLITKG